MTTRSVVVQFTADDKGYITGVKNMETATSAFAKSAEQKLAATKANGFDKLTTAAAGVGLVVGALAVKAVSSFADFDAAMSAAGAATVVFGESTQAAADRVDQLRALAIQMGADTQYSATEAAQGITEMGKAGVSAADILGGGLKGALDLAAAGSLDVGEAGQIAATAMTQFGLAGKDIPHVADLLAAAAGKAQGSVEDVANALKYAGPVAKGLGVSIEETTGTLAEFASQGIIGEQAGTSLRGVLLALAAPTQAASKVMAEYGINLYDANGKFIGVSGAADELHSKLGGLDDATRTAALNQIFGNQQITAAQILYQGGAQAVQEWTSKVNDAGYAQKQAATLTDNLKGDVERLRGSLDTAFIQTGSAANGALRTLVQSLTDVVNYVSGIPAPLLLAGAAFSALALGLPKGIQVYRDYRTSLNDVGISLDRVTAKAPRLGAALETTVTGAKKLGVALAVTAAAAKTFDGDIDTIGPQQLANDLLTTSDAAGTLNKALAGATGTGTNYASAVNSISAALQATFNPSTFQDIDNFTGKLSGLNKSDPYIAAQRINEIDAALTNLVQSDHADKAAAAFEQIAAAAQAQGISVDDLKKKFPQYGEALAAVAAQTAALTTEQSGAALASGQVATALDGTTQSAEDVKQALDDARQAFLDYGNALSGSLNAQVDFKQAVADADNALKGQKDSLARSKAGLDSNTQAGRDNVKALTDIADKARAAALATYDQTGKTSDLTASINASRAAFIDTATKMGLTRAAAGTLADQLGLTQANVAALTANLDSVPHQVTSKVTADTGAADAALGVTKGKLTTLDFFTAKPDVAAQTSTADSAFGVTAQRLTSLDLTTARPQVVAVTAPALAAIAQVRDNLNSLNGKTATTSIFNRTVNTTQNVVVGVSSQAALDAAAGKASGGAVVGPGTGTSDTAGLFRLSNGEHVWTAAEVAAAGGHAAMASMRKAVLDGTPGYAAGGPVGLAGGGQVQLNLSSFYQDFINSLGNPVTLPDIFGKVSNINAAKNTIAETNNAAVKSVRALAEAEAALDAARRNGQSAADVVAGEQKVADARIAVTAATTKASAAQKTYVALQADLIRSENAYNAQQRSPLQKFTSALTIGVRDSAAFVKNLEKIASRGYPELAQQLAGLSNADAEKIAAQAAAASTGTLASLSATVKAGVSAQSQLNNIGAITSILGTKGDLTAAAIAAATGYSISDILSASSLISALLGPSGKGKLLGDVQRFKAGTYAGGGAVAGAGSGTSDSVPIWASNGEHVWTAAETVAAGGHSAVAAMRKAALYGAVRYAGGGPVGQTYAAAALIQGPSNGPGGGYREGPMVNIETLLTTDPNAAAKAIDRRLSDSLTAAGF